MTAAATGMSARVQHPMAEFAAQGKQACQVFGLGSPRCSRMPNREGVHLHTRIVRGSQVYNAWGLRTCGSVENGAGAQEQQDTNEGVVQEADVEEHLPNKADQLSIEECTGIMPSIPYMILGSIVANSVYVACTSRPRSCRQLQQTPIMHWFAGQIPRSTHRGVS